MLVRFGYKGGLYMIFFLIALFVFLLDWNIKNYIEDKFHMGKRKDIFNGKVTIKKQYNSGFCLNFLDNKKELVKKVTAIVFGVLALAYVIIIPGKHKSMKKIGLSLCLGGAASNVLDRYKRGYVIDYFTINIKPIKNIVFNLADIFIFIGSFITFLTSLSDGSSIHPNIEE